MVSNNTNNQNAQFFKYIQGQQMIMSDTTNKLGNPKEAEFISKNSIYPNPAKDEILD
jgi:hypothetical protein